MSNDVKIKVTADDRGAGLGGAKKESAGLRDQVVADTAAMRAASERVTKAREREENAAGRVRIAEKALNEVREVAKPGSARLAAAEERLSAAHRASEQAARGSTEATQKLGEARAKAAAAAEEQAAKAEAAAAKLAAKDQDSKVSGPRFDMSKSFLDKGQLLSEAKSIGVQAGVLLAGGMGSGLTSVGAAGMFVGIAAAAQSSNQQVRAAYSGMWEQIKTSAQADSAVLAGTFIESAQSLGKTFNDLRPELVEGFAAAKPVINDVMDGIDRGAKAAMPGLVTGAHAASEASNGLADMMESAGRAVGNFFTESSKGAAKSGDAFRAFGMIVERLGTFAGRIFAELSNNSGTVLAPLVGAVDSVAGAVENLAHSALPALASGASFALTGLGLLVNLASMLLGALGPLLPAISTIASALKLVDMVSFGQVGKSWGEFKASVGEGEGVFGKLKAGAGGLLSTLGPVGLAAGLVTVGLGFLSTEQAAAAAATASHAKRVDLLSDSLRKSNGAITENVRVAAAQALQNMAVNRVYQDGEKIKKDMLTGARELNINQRLLTDAYLGQGDAMGQLNHQLDSIMSPYKDYNDMVAHANPEEQKRWLLAELMKDTLNKQGGEFGEAAKRASDFAAATGAAGQVTNKLAAEFKTLADDASSAADKTSALVKIMDTIAGRKPDLEQATKAWEEFIDAFNVKDAGFESKAAGTKKWAESLLLADGSINLTTADGRKLFDTVQNGEKDFAATAEAMKASGASSEEARGKLQTLRDEFIAHARQLGFTSKEAENLANKYGMIPSNVVTLVYSNLSPEIQKAISLGGLLLNMPDGSVEIITHTQGAQDRINKFIQTNDGRVITLHVNTTSGVTLNTTGGNFSRVKAGGGAVAHAAEGGARSGAVMVNERGLMEGIRTPGGELWDMEAGSSVVPHANMQGIRNGGGGGAVDVRVSFDVAGASNMIERLFGEIVKKMVRISGKSGSLQATFG